ncbi:hypothetical protein LSTR_LSTR006331 [Laodelphax striatellus]|uniref:Sodium-coupled monocarboxylate transporter 1 n=1 Tax=Laodelphax striatellus TaxID=195883 RepID=A0A482XE20_LAOST|nr:hypothetical protein LSTR_LSTR006331 [Laodelphax striatellus]
MGFTWLDYSVFAFMLFASTLVGVYFAFFTKRKQNSTAEYLVGGRSMGVFPVSMSLIASYISGISLLGIPAEIYTYGTQYWLVMISEALVSVTMAYVYLPVFYSLNITSSYEYLSLRFNSTVRLFGSCLFLLKMMLYIPIVIYVPALALSQVIGINLHLITPLVCAVCIFYTSLGGVRAVVWTDCLQTIMMLAGAILVVVIGSRDLSPSLLWQRNMDSGRIDFFNWEIDPTIRHTVWSVTFGNYFYWLAACSVNQAMVQRCLALPSVRQAKMAIVILAVGIASIVSICCYTGLLIYAYYYDCDPVSTKRIGKADQLLPLYVLEVASVLPGLPGIFMAGVFSAALSTMSTGWNSMAGVIYEDLVKPRLKKPMSELNASRLMKGIVVIIGILCTALVFAVEKLGMLIQAGKSLGAITAGPLLGMFSLGILFPSSNSKGALFGGIASIFLVAWISLNSQVAIANKRLVYPVKPISTSGCNETVFPTEVDPSVTITGYDDVLPFYRLSYMYFTFIGTITAILVGLIVSKISGGNDTSSTDPRLFSPWIRRHMERDLPKKEKVILEEHKF